MKKRRLIDIDKIKPIDFPSTEMDGLDVVRYLNTLPTVDAVEVVRCKDCKYYELDEGDFLGECHCKHIPMNFSGELYPERDFFCAYGERK